jgi:translocation and assembly module TamB
MHLGLIQAITGEVTDVEGLVTVDLRVTGSPATPVLGGSILIAGGAFTVPATGAKYRQVEADLSFTGSRLAIGRLTLDDADGGRLALSGGLDVLGEAAARGLDVQVLARNLRVLDNDFGAAEVDADLRLGGTFGAPQLRGTAALASGRLEVARILERTTARPYSTEAQAPLSSDAAPATPSLFDRADVNVRLSLPDNLLMRGRDLRTTAGGFGIGDMNIVAGGAFDVTKPAGEPFAVLGALEVVRGSYTFQGRRFEVARGSDVGFRGGPVDNPTLNIRATREISGVTAEVRLRGTARSPEVALTSRPPLDEGEILSLIVFNQPINSLGAAERVNLGERAAAMATGAVTTPLADSIAAALNLDLLEIRPPTSDDGAAAVAIGGRLGSRIFVGVRQEFGRDAGSLLTLEYRVNRVLRFVTSVAQGTLQANATRRADQGGVDLLFVIRY